MNILLTGASGFVGSHLASTLIAAGHQLTSISRRHGQDLAQLRQPDDWLPWLQGIDVVINAAGIIAEQGQQRFTTVHQHAPCALFSACVSAGIRRVIQISALGADPQAGTAYHRSKGLADSHLQDLPLDWSILRPGLLYGPGGSSSALFMRLARLPWLFTVSGGQQCLQPLHISDLCAAVLRMLAGEAKQQCIELVGPHAWQFADWLRFLRAAQGLPPTCALQVPPRLAFALLTVARHLNPLLQADNLRMLLASVAANPEPTRQLLGRSPIAAQAWLLHSHDDRAKGD